MLSGSGNGVTTRMQNMPERKTGNRALEVSGFFIDIRTYGALISMVIVFYTQLLVNDNLLDYSGVCLTLIRFVCRGG